MVAIGAEIAIFLPIKPLERRKKLWNMLIVLQLGGCLAGRIVYTDVKGFVVSVAWHMTIIISNKIREKLKDKHGVHEEEVGECFANLAGDFLRDQREDHRSDPPTLWFIAETYMGRRLKVAFIPVDGDFHIRTAYEPNDEEVRIYKKYGEHQ